MARVLLLGASGFIGGEALSQITKVSSKVRQITCIVRDEHQTKSIVSAYPNVKVSQADTQGFAQKVESEARDSDVVFNLASTNNEPIAQSIYNGLTSSERSPRKTPYWIQISGASMFGVEEIKAGRYGEPSDAVYDDVADVKKTFTTISSNPARKVDNMVLKAKGQIKTALIVGPHIYGEGRGPINQRSIQTPEWTRETLQRKAGFRLGRGLNIWSTVHIHDLGDMLKALLEAALEDKEGLWNEDGIFFPEHGQMSFGDVAMAVAKAAYDQKLIPDSTITEVIDAKVANEMTPHGAVVWGTNAVLRGSRARKMLHWNPTGISLADDIPNIVAKEAKRMGLAD